MGVKDKMQHKLGRLFTSADAANGRAQQFFNYLDAESIAVVFYHESEEQYKFVREYLKGVKEKYGVRSIMALAFVDEKNPPHYIQSKLEFEYFTRKNVNWQQKPSGITVDNFINEEYNLLIDLTDGNIPAIQHIVAHSKANCKVGHRIGNMNDPYDLMIQMPKKSFDMKKFIELLNHYLTAINRKAASV